MSDVPYLFKLGPVETEADGDFWVFLVVTPDFADEPVFAKTDADGLRELLAVPRTTPFVVEPRLAAEAAKHGLASGPLPEWVLGVRATLALMLGLGGVNIASEEPAASLVFLAAATEFYERRPWEAFGDGMAFVLDVSGAHAGRYELALMGTSGIEYGISIHRELGASAKMSALTDEGRYDEAAKLVLWSTTFEDTPEWAATAIGEAFGSKTLPMPLRLEQGELADLELVDVLAISACLRAASQLSATKTTTDASVSFEGVEVTAKLTLPAEAGGSRARADLH